MFTGIIEDLGIVCEIQNSGTNRLFWIKSSISNELKVDQSLAHNGVCLTVVDLKPSMHCVCAIDETLQKTNLLAVKEGDFLNLERCLKVDARLDGHWVQGHVDGQAICREIKDLKGSYELRFKLEKEHEGLIVEKGSISLNGISLTVFKVERDSFSVGIIPYTWAHTNLKQLQIGAKVNIEFDILGKYVQARLAANAVVIK